MADDESIPQHAPEPVTQKPVAAPSPPRQELQPIISWGSIEPDSGDHQEDPIPPEIRAKLDRAKAREGIAMLAVDTVMSTRTLEQQYQIMATRSQKTPDTLYENERTRATRALQDAQHVKEEFARAIAKGQIPESEMTDYASTIYFTALELTSSDREISQYTLIELVSTAETLENARLFQQFAQQWKTRFINGVDEQTARIRLGEFKRVIGELAGTGRIPKPESRSTQEMTELFGAFADVYEVAYSLPQDEQSKIGHTLTFGAKEVGKRTHDAEQVRRVLAVFKEVANHPDRVLVEKFIDTVTRYSWNHGLTEDAAQSFVQKLFPAMEANDPQVALLIIGGNIWGMEEGDFGAADFLCYAYALRVTPSNINQLLMIAREMSTTNMTRFEQNRLDGLTLSAPFGALRDFIHDQRPYVHEVIKAMVLYYDTGDSRQLLSVLSSTDTGYLGSDERRALLLRRDSYNTETEEVRADGNPQHERVKPIDVLRRLIENTKTIENAAPVTTDQQFNQLLQSLAENGVTDRGSLQRAMDYANSRMVAMMQVGEIGIDPNHIVAYAWLERRGFDALQRLTYEDQVGAYRQEWFQSLLRFQDLTTSPDGFNEEEFQQFLGQVTNATSARDAYRLIFQRTLSHISRLSDIYKGMGKGNRVGALWSGNVAHELIGLTDLRPAQTAYGKTHRKEMLRSEPDRLKGD